MVKLYSGDMWLTLPCLTDFYSMKQRRVLLVPPRCEAGLSQGSRPLPPPLSILSVALGARFSKLPVTHRAPQDWIF